MNLGNKIVKFLGYRRGLAGVSYWFETERGYEVMASVGHGLCASMQTSLYRGATEIDRQIPEDKTHYIEPVEAFERIGFEVGAQVEVDLMLVRAIA